MDLNHGGLNMRDEVIRDWEWADSYRDDIARIVGFYAVEIASIDQDLNEATDGIIKGHRLGYRMRSYKYIDHQDVSIRSKRKDFYGCLVKTEIDKIQEGYIDWYFYGCEGKNGEIAKWILFDMNKVREANLIKRYMHTEKWNPDGITAAIYIPVWVLKQQNCIIDGRGWLTFLKIGRSNE